ncbi:MAG: MerR family transcriptional regulator [Clostridia bacterium]
MDKQNLFSIGDVAKLFHLSVSSLRHYEDVGLITPEYTDPDSGYRYYGARQFEVLNSIRYLRALDYAFNRDYRLPRQPRCGAYGGKTAPAKTGGHC